jgi:hypothetical protein
MATGDGREWPTPEELSDLVLWGGIENVCHTQPFWPELQALRAEIVVEQAARYRKSGYMEERWRARAMEMLATLAQQNELPGVPVSIRDLLIAMNDPNVMQHFDEDMNCVVLNPVGNEETLAKRLGDWLKGAFAPTISSAAPEDAPVALAEDPLVLPVAQGKKKRGKK